MAIALILFLIVLNGVLAMSEIAVVSSRRARLQGAADAGKPGAKAALALIDSPTRFLSTVQIGITLIGIFAGAFGESSIANQLEAKLRTIPALEAHSQWLSLVVVVLSITYLSLVIGELIPKRIGMSNPERIASFVARPMRVLSKIVAPFVSLLSFSTDLLLKLLPAGHFDEQPVTAEEINLLIERGTEAGVFHEAEQELVERVFHLGNQRISGLMVPRSHIVWLDIDDTPEQNERIIQESSHSHFPICEGNLDRLVGVIHIKDLARTRFSVLGPDLRASARAPLFVPEGAPAIKVLETFRKSRSHIAFVLDEYGVLKGLITLNDIVGGIVGVIARRGDETEPLEIRRHDGSWLLDGMLPVARLKEIMEVGALPKEDEAEFQTLGGFVTATLGRIPGGGERFPVPPGFWFEVLDMDKQRVDKVLLTVEPDAGPSADGAARSHAEDGA